MPFIIILILKRMKERQKGLNTFWRFFEFLYNYPCNIVSFNYIRKRVILKNLEIFEDFLSVSRLYLRLLGPLKVD